MQKARFTETQIIAIFKEVREIPYWWMNDNNELRPHDSLDDITPVEFMEKHTGNSTFILSA